MKSLDLLAKLALEQSKNDLTDTKNAQDLLKEILKQQSITEKDLALNEMNNLSKLLQIQEVQDRTDSRHAETLLKDLIESEEKNENDE